MGFIVVSVSLSIVPLLHRLTEKEEEEEEEEEEEGEKRIKLHLHVLFKVLHKPV